LFFLTLYYKTPLRFAETVVKYIRLRLFLPILYYTSIDCDLAGRPRTAVMPRVKAKTVRKKSFILIILEYFVKKGK
jgi:hypothetical protein